MAGRSFRANPRYELVLLDRLSPGERQLLGDLEGDADLYGILRPRPGCGLEVRSASSDVALLFLTLAEPGPLPTYLVTRLGDEMERTIGRLVVDSVLEVEDKGEYLCGAAAAGLVLPARSEGGRGRIGELSRAALHYGQELLGLPVSLLARRLYCYGRSPISPELRRRLPDETAVAAYLGTGPSGSAGKALEAAWHEVPAGDGQRSPWRRWYPRAAPRRGPGMRGARYKLYVSPAVDDLGDAIGTVASSLATTRGVSALKFGSDVRGISRPDKLVAYFDRLEDLQRSGAVLRDRLDGCRPHGVPFTAAITHEGLLSWAADPPGSSSWRMWVTERLAEYLTLAGDSGDGELEPWQFALDRLRLNGIDTDSWVPASGMWPQALMTG